MPILRTSNNSITKNMTEFEKSLGIDLKINQDGDLELSNTNDLKVVAGVNNAAQAIFIKLNVEPGSLTYHPEIGTDLQIGSKTKSAFGIKTQIYRSMSVDDRFEDTSALIQILGDVVVVDLKVKLTNTGIEIPLQFASPA